MDLALMLRSLPALLEGAWVTIQLVALALLAGFAVALPVALMRVSRRRWLRAPAFAYVFCFRGTPLLVQIYLAYYGLGQFEAIRQSALWPVLREPYWCAILAFALNTAAYTAEILLGMSRTLLFRRIVFPKAFRLALPAYGNEIILMVKASALASTITLLDLTGVARTIIARTFAPVELFLAAGALYLLINFALTRVIGRVEHRLSPHLRPSAAT
jgi:polar amino acid transport system permease protein